jgi:hypothetical protein
MNKSQADIHALLHGSSLTRCYSGPQGVWCRVLTLDEVSRLEAGKPIWATGLSDAHDVRLRYGYVTSVGDDLKGFTYERVIKYDPHVPVEAGWLMYQRGLYFRMRRYVEPLEDDDE